MHANQPSTLRRFFSGLAEFTFQTRLGVADPPLIDYLSDLLTRFVRYDMVYCVRDLYGRPVTEVAEMLYEAEQRIGDARRQVHRHIGDYTLFWTGLYPESLRRKQSTEKKDHMVDYYEQGKRAYWIASTIDSDDEKERRAPSHVLERLSRQFEMCAYGLREVRREWEESNDDPPRPFLIN